MGNSAAAAVSTTGNSNLCHVPLSLIVTGDNPRRHFDPAKLAELVESIRVRGVIQPVCLRTTIDGLYSIVAGERRVRASRIALGDDYQIPANVIEANDDEAFALAVIENIHRADLSPTEESDAAALILDRNKGDLVSTASELHWNVGTLRKRLALQNLTTKCKEALDTRQILLAMAELLAASPLDKQDDALDKIIERKLTVAEVRDTLLAKSLDIAGAIFDTKDCTACRYNSSEQGSLFTEHIGVEGQCTSPQCFCDKTDAHLEQLRAELAEEEFPNARIVSAGDSSFHPLTEQTVGSDQYNACKACGEFGAAVSNVSGQVGVVTKSVCFNGGCRKEKITALAKSIQDAEEASRQCTPPVEPPQENAGEEGKKKGRQTKAKTTKPVKAAPKPTAAVLSTKVKEWRRKFWDLVVKVELVAQPDKARAFLIDLAVNGLLRHVKGEELAAVYEKLTGNNCESRFGSENAIGALVFALPPEIQGKLQTAIVVTAIPELSEKKVKEALALLEADLTKHFTLDQTFLDLLTKSELESLCTELALDAAIGDTYKKVSGGKRGEFITAILAAAPFEFKGAVPSALNY